MLRYNTQLERLKLPEYGRNIQNMVEHCLTLTDRDERNACARSIIEAMIRLTPQAKNDPDHTRKLWDHLAIISDFRLDIDYPFDQVEKDTLQSTPERVAYGLQNIRYRHYGKSVERLVATASAMEPGQERDTLVRLIANHMKKLMLEVNCDGVDDMKIFKDLAELSHGEIRIHPEEMRLHEFKAVQQPAGKKRRKR
ncbi:DUF4290 domain-containing protein [Muribaculaceae bacterium Isolate-105 (HZI)]|nr:DUF4290 domain-containing protein [Muribaculaceae bacterium Isolate-105 (HZI)]